MSVINFLRQALSARKGIDLSVLELRLGDHGVDGAPRHGPVLRRPVPQRGLLRWREEAQRDPPDGDPRARGRHPRRDRLRARHRRAQGGGPRGAGGAARPPRPRRGGHHPLPAPARPPRARRGAHPRRRAHRRLRRARSWPSASSATATRPGDDRDARRRPPSARTSRSSSARCTAAGSSTSTRPTRRRSRKRCSTPWSGTTSSRTPTCTAAPTSSPRRPPPPSRAPAPRSRGSSGRRTRREVVFTKNATEALNLVAKAWGRANLQAGDAVVLTELEHHANIVPWHQLHDELGIELRWIPDPVATATSTSPTSTGWSTAPRSSPSPPCRTCSARCSRSSGWSSAAHDAGAIAVVDASQYVPHLATDVQAWGADFAAFTGHKMCGPTGIGVLWGTTEILEATPPFLTGGEMILNVTKEGFTPNELPWKFEAGTPPIAEAVGLGAAVDYLEGLGMDAVREHEVSLTAYALRSLTERFGDDLTIHGPSEPAARGGVLSFTYGDLHPHDLTQVFDEHGVCVRAGSPLRQAPDARARRRRHRPRLAVRLQRRGRRRRPRRRHRRRRHVLLPDRISRPECLASKTCTERSSSTTTAPRGTAASSTPARHPGGGLQPALRRRDRRLRRRAGRHRRRHPHRRPGLLDQPVVGVDDVGRREGQDPRRGAGSSPGPSRA